MPSTLQTYFSKINCAALFLIFISTDSIHAEDSWKHIKTTDGIGIYTRTIEGSPIKAFKGDVHLKATLPAILAVFEDTSEYEEWLYGCKEARMLGDQTDFYHRHIYQVNRPPYWGVSERDYILEVRLSLLPDNRGATIDMRSVADFIDEIQYIRVKRATGSYSIVSTGEDEYKMTWQQHLEPEGNLPSFIVNRLLSDIPFNTLTNFRRILTRPRYREAAFLYSVDGQVNKIQFGPDQ